MTTASGLPISVAPLPPGAYTPLAALAYRAGYADSAALLAAATENDVPPLPFHQRMGGQLMLETSAAQAWLGELAKYREGKAERDIQRRNAEATRRHEAHMRRLADEEAGYAHGREMQALWEQTAADRARNEAVNAERAAGHQAIVLDAHGKRVY